jgi:hypothetical protein
MMSLIAPQQVFKKKIRDIIRDKVSLIEIKEVNLKGKKCCVIISSIR